jgi:ABC-type molybdate transport system permease subunit
MQVEKQIIREQILKQNLRRFLIMPLVSIPINIGHILFFSFSKPDAGSPEYEWYQGIIASHSVLALIAIADACTWPFQEKNYRCPATPSPGYFFMPSSC